MRQVESLLNKAPGSGAQPQVFGLERRRKSRSRLDATVVPRNFGA